MDREMVPHDAPLPAICPAGRGPDDVDPVCAFALTHGSCAPDGSAYVRCTLSPADRRAIGAGSQ